MTRARVPPLTSPSRERAVLLGLLLLGILLRLTGLSTHSLWLDEGCTLHLAHAPNLVEALRGDRHPPLSFLFFKYWIAVFGEEDPVLRLFPALLSCASLLLFASLARSWLGGGAALAAVALYAVSPFAVWYGQEVRMYAFLEFFSLVTIASSSRYLASPRAGWLALVAIGTALTFGSQYLGALIFSSVFANGLLARARKELTTKQASSLALASLAGLLVWIPWLVALAPDQLRSPWAYLDKSSFREIAEFPAAQVFTHLSVLGSSSIAIGYATAVLLYAGMIAFAIQAIRSRERGLLLVLACFVVPVAAALVFAATFLPSFGPRYVSVSAPFTAMMMAGGLALAIPGRARFWIVALACSGCLAVTLALKNGNHRDEFRAACRELEEQWKPGDVVVVITGVPEGFSEGVVRHYLRENEPILRSVVDNKEFSAEASASMPPGSTIHVIRRTVAYTEQEFRALVAKHPKTNEGEVRFQIQYVRLEG